MRMSESAWHLFSYSVYSRCRLDSNLNTWVVVVDAILILFICILVPQETQNGDDDEEVEDRGEEILKLFAGLDILKVLAQAEHEGDNKQACVDAIKAGNADKVRGLLNDNSDLVGLNAFE